MVRVDRRDGVRVNIALEEGRSWSPLAMLAVLGFRFGLRGNEYQQSDRSEVAKSFGTGKLFVFMGFNRSMTSKHSVQHHVLLNASRVSGLAHAPARVLGPQSFRPMFFQAHGWDGVRRTKEKKWLREAR